jgi:hypothetical protein
LRKFLTVVPSIVTAAIAVTPSAARTPAPECHPARSCYREGPVSAATRGEALYSQRMFASRFNEPIQPMTLGNMRANSVYSLAVSLGNQI